MKLRKLFAGTPAHPPMPEWRPLDEDDEPDGIIALPGKELTPAEVDEVKARWLAAQKSGEPPTVLGQCAAITGAGKRCALPAKPGSDRCVLPSHQKM